MYLFYTRKGGIEIQPTEYDLRLTDVKREDNILTGYVLNGAWWFKSIESCIIGNTVYAYNRNWGNDWLVTTMRDVEYVLQDSPIWIP